MSKIPAAHFRICHSLIVLIVIDNYDKVNASMNDPLVAHLKSLRLTVSSFALNNTIFHRYSADYEMDKLLASTLADIRRRLK